MPMRLRTEMPELAGVTEWVNGEVSKADLKPANRFWFIFGPSAAASVKRVSRM